MRETSLPSIFGKWASQVRYVQATDKAGTKFTSACPTCGGDLHQNGDLPDRCLWWMTSRNGAPMGYCTHCKRTYWADSNISDADKAEARAFVQERLDANARRAQALADAFRDSRKWELWHEQMGEFGRIAWRKRGIPDSWQDFWQFGVGTYNVYGDGAWIAARTLTIPLFDETWECRNVKHRLLDATDYAGKYRPEVAGVGALPFLCDPTKALNGPVMIVEGEIKAAVVAVTLDSPVATIVGIPGLNPSPKIIAQLKDAERITLVLDPDAAIPPVLPNGEHGKPAMVTLAEALGRQKCRVLIPPVKIDDGILASGMTAGELSVMLRSATAL